ncbi:MAG TPA: hypothetical protein VLA82_04295 [Actinomycetota bacterium]|nr:hypothetical protein [Actinomycetota bacterium]
MPERSRRRDLDSAASHAPERFRRDDVVRRIDVLDVRSSVADAVPSGRPRGG